MEPCDLIGPERGFPAGLRDGQKVRIRELGGLGKHGGAPGDLYFIVHIDR
ncbi:DnaJ C-terminal domain-containing protein [Streptomyces griseochromogenes]